MKLKYKEMSIVGKVWTLAELYNAGVGDEKKSYVRATITRLYEMLFDEETLSSHATKESSISNILNHITGYTAEFKNDESVVSILWYNRAWLDDVKSRTKNSQIESSDLAILQDVYLEIKRLYINNLKEKKLSIEESRDLLLIKKEIEDLKNKIQTRVTRNQIDVI